MKNQIQKETSHMLQAILGVVFFAAAYRWFLVPAGLYSGGFTGVSQLVKLFLTEALHMPMPETIDVTGIIFWCINLPLFVLGYKSIGRKFLYRTVIAVCIQSFLLVVIPAPKELLLDDMLLNCMIGGALSGWGVGMTLRAGGSGGGTDIVGMYCAKNYPEFGVGKLSVMINLCIYLIAAVRYDLEVAAYSMVFSIMSGIMVDRVHDQNIKVSAFIVTKNKELGERINRTVAGGIVKILFAENPGIVIQISDKHKDEVKKILEDAGVGYIKLGKPTDERHILVSKDGATYQFGIDYMRDVWYSSSYLLDRKQSMNGCAKKRFENYKMQPVEFAFMPEFKGKLSQYGITPDRRTPSGIRAAIIREKGTNGEREMAYSLYLAGFDVKDVTMTDLISGREILEDVNMIVYCGGFSNSDVLGSAKGWAGGFLFNPKAKEALDKFYAREDTLSLGICNGCQLMMELGLINPEHKKKGKMLHNDSHKFESTFVGLTIPTNRSVMFGSLSGSKLGIWVAHGEGKFSLPYDEDKYNVVAKYSYDEYPGNPNGSDYSIAGLASADGRHLAMMPHLERAIFPWQNGCYPADRKNSDQVTPWIEAFVNARKWVEAKMK